MSRSFFKMAPVSLGLVEFFNVEKWINSGPDGDSPSAASKVAVQKYMEDLSPWQRLKLIYTVDEIGSISPELNSIRQAAFYGGFVGALFGGIVHSRVSYINFMEKNMASSFETSLEAKKVLQNNVTVGFARGAFKLGWRVALFATTYTAVSTNIAVYRGKTSFLDYTVAGGITGMMYKANMGLRGMAAGGLAGSVLGTVAGLLTVGLLKFTGQTMEDVRYWQYAYHQKRDKMFKENFHYTDETTPALIVERRGVGEDTLDVLDRQLKKLEELEKGQAKVEKK